MNNKTLDRPSLIKEYVHKYEVKWNAGCWGYRYYLIYLKNAKKLAKNNNGEVIKIKGKDTSDNSII